MISNIKINYKPSPQTFTLHTITILIHHNKHIHLFTLPLLTQLICTSPLFLFGRLPSDWECIHVDLHQHTLTLANEHRVNWINNPLTINVYVSFVLLVALGIFVDDKWWILDWLDINGKKDECIFFLFCLSSDLQMSERSIIILMLHRLFYQEVLIDNLQDLFSLFFVFYEHLKSIIKTWTKVNYILTTYFISTLKLNLKKIQFFYFIFCL